MSQNPFLKATESYTRQINPIGQYIDQMTHYLNSMTGDPLDACRAYILNALKTQAFPNMRDPVIRHYERLDNGDNHVTETPLSHFIQNVIRNGYILAPSFTVYLHPEMRRSILVNFTEKNKKLRSIAKKKSHQAKAEGNLAEHTYQENVQSKKKIYNNAMSGSFGTEGTVLYNPTAHSTLTSITRTVVSLCNATNERMLAGNRHYWSPDIVINNIISTITHTDREAMTAVMTRYALHYPTVEEMMQVIQYSTDLYWRDGRYLQTIRTYVETLDPLQRAAFVYTGDFYHLRLFNSDCVRTFLQTLATIVTTAEPNSLARVKTLNEDIVLFSHQVCAMQIKGMGKNYDKMAEAGVLDAIVGTADHIYDTIGQYRDLIDIFFLTDNLPASIAQIPHMLRRVVPLSDTDSSCYSVDKWVEWYQGNSAVNATSLGIAAAVAYLTTQSMAHILAILSANMNTPKEYLYVLAVKGEYIWDAFMLTSKAKHYAARTIYQEGNVYAEPEYDTKGVHLISSASPVSLIKNTHATIRGILDTVASGQKISLYKLLRSIGDVERSITLSLLQGDEEYCRSMMIKDAAGYVLPPDKSPFQHYTLWQEVFAPKYGSVNPPPYVAIKIPTKLENKTAVKQWLQAIVDRELASRLEAWMRLNKKTTIGMFLIPLDHVQSHGIPEELKAIMDTKRVVLELTNGYRLVLESLGFYCKKQWLISEMGY